MPNYVLIDGVFTPLTYTVAEIDTMLSVVPISRFGDTTTDTVPVVMEANAVRIGPVPVFFAGRKYQLAQTSVPIPATASATYYLYLKLVGGVLGIITSASPLDETLTQMYVGKVTTTGGGSVATVGLEAVTRIDIYRLSPTRRGTAIPVSTGYPYNSATLSW